MKKISLGTEDFKEMIDHQYYYIDKSEWILTALYDKVSLFTRPRRFGKHWIWVCFTIFFPINKSRMLISFKI